jgi:hypothetical protein
MQGVKTFDHYNQVSKAGGWIIVMNKLPEVFHHSKSSSNEMPIMILPDATLQGLDLLSVEHHIQH